jgi:hypothetical protein
MRCGSSRSKNAVARRARVVDAFVFLCAGACFAVACCVTANADSPQASPALSQAQIGAAFIFNFAKFTEWPTQAFSDSSAPLTVCFLGADEVRSAFQEISAGKVVNGRPVLVRNVKSAGEVLDCRVVYIDSANSALFPSVLKNTRQRCGLVIGTSDDFLARGGIIKLQVENNRMRFDVNIGAAGRTKIHLSSKLLALARSVVDLPDPAGN